MGFIKLRKPALNLSDIVQYLCTVINRSIVVRALAARSPELLGRAENEYQILQLMFRQRYEENPAERGYPLAG